MFEQPYRVVKDYDDGCVEGYTKDGSQVFNTDTPQGPTTRDCTKI